MRMTFFLVNFKSMTLKITKQVRIPDLFIYLFIYLLKLIGLKWFDKADKQDVPVFPHLNFLLVFWMIAPFLEKDLHRNVLRYIHLLQFLSAVTSSVTTYLRF